MLRDKVLKALAWQTGAKFLTQVFSLTVIVILARKLSPSDFGLVGMAFIFTGFLNLIGEFGIGSSIIRTKNITREQTNSVFWFSLFFGISMFVLSFSLAPSIAGFFAKDELKTIIRVLSLSFVINSLRTVPFSLLTQELKFDQRSKSEIVSIASGGVIAISLAYSGFGVWSLVYSTLARGVIFVSLVYVFSSWRPEMSFHRDAAKGMINFGAKVIAARIQWYFYSNADFFIIGKMLGDHILGYYTMAFKMAMLPTERITAIVNQVMFPTFSKLQDDEERLNRYFLKVTRYVAMVTFPIMTLIFVLAEEITIVFLTEKWLPAVFPLRVLCLIGMLKSIDVIIPSVLLAKGRAGINLRFNTILFFVLPAAFFLGCRAGGMDGVAYSWLFLYPLLVSYLFYLGLRELNMLYSDYIGNLFPPIFGSMIMAGVVLLIKYAFGFFAEFCSFVPLVITSILGLESYAIFQYLYVPSEFHGLMNIVRQATGRDGDSKTTSN